METLQRYTLGELKQLAVYLEEFQACQFVEPTDVRKKRSWKESVNQMITEKGPENPSLYIIRIRKIIRWFLDHRFKFVRGRGDIFFVRMTHDFVYTITETTIHLEDSRRLVFEIDRAYMDLTKHDGYVRNNPTNRTLSGGWTEDFFNRPVTRSTSTYTATHNTATHTKELDKPPRTLKLDIIDEEATDETRVLECKICTINKICVVLTQCGHTFCYSCTTRFENKCATCRTPFTDTTAVQIFI